MTMTGKKNKKMGYHCSNRSQRLKFFKLASEGKRKKPKLLVGFPLKVPPYTHYTLAAVHGH
jgi:hypothetical protein